MVLDMLLTVTAVRAEALDVLSVELRNQSGTHLPSFAPGAHLEVEVPGSRSGTTLIRHYSICNDNREQDRYVIAVARPLDSRGGSAAIHNLVRVGSTLCVRGPRNNFPLEQEAQFYRFIAGGIGITPIISMILWCVANNKRWSLLYCVRSKTRAAFFETLSAMKNNVRFHFDDESVPAVPDLKAELCRTVSGEHAYCCGPAALMHAVRDLCSERKPDSVHFEWFSPDPTTVADTAPSEFEVILRRSGLRFGVPKDQSILETLETNGISVPNSCREGVCGTCETTVCSGEVDHRDHVLSKSERMANKSMMVCVSRAVSSSLELDL
jgi:tetrachlorobenzoquinone reductase